MPTLIVWGERDRIIPLAHAYRAHEAIPNSRLEVSEGVGHYSHVEEPAHFGSNENTNGLLRQYLPKGTELSGYSQTHLNAVARELNERPRCAREGARNRGQ